MASEGSNMSLSEVLKSNTTALLQLKKKKDELHSEVDSLKQQIQTTISEVIKFKKDNPRYKENSKLKEKGIEIVKKKHSLEYKLGKKEKQLLSIINMINKLLMVRKQIKAQLQNLNGGGASSSRPKPVNDGTENEYTNLLLKRSDLIMSIIKIDDDLNKLGEYDELTDDMKELIVQQHQLEQEKLKLDAIIEFMEKEIYPDEEQIKMQKQNSLQDAELEKELEALLNEEEGPQTGGKHNNKISKQVGDTISPQDEYYGKLYLEDNMLYYYDMNFHKVLTDKIPIISIPKLEKLLKEYKKTKNTLSNSHNNIRNKVKSKTNKSKSNKNNNKKRKTQKKKQ